MALYDRLETSLTPGDEIRGQLLEALSCVAFEETRRWLMNSAGCDLRSLDA